MRHVWCSLGGTRTSVHLTVGWLSRIQVSDSKIFCERQNIRVQWVLCKWRPDFNAADFYSCLQAFTTISSIGHNWSLYLDAFNNLSKTENHSHVLGTRQHQLTEEVRPLGGYFFFFIFSLSIGDGVWCLGAAGSVHHHHRHHRHPWHQWSNKQGRKLPRCDSYLRNLKRLFTHRHKA